MLRKNILWILAIPSILLAHSDTEQLQFPKWVVDGVFAQSCSEYGSQEESEDGEYYISDQYLGHTGWPGGCFLHPTHQLLSYGGRFAGGELFFVLGECGDDVIGDYMAQMIIRVITASGENPAVRINGYFDSSENSGYDFGIDGDYGLCEGSGLDILNEKRISERRIKN